MTNREFYLERRRAEMPVFLKVLRAVPADQLDYKPHERSPSAGQLMWTLTAELRSCLDVVLTGRAEWKSEPAPSYADMLALFEAWSNELTERVAAMEDEAWERNAPFFYQGRMVSEQPAGAFLWMVLFDAVHHRGQLTTYLRPMGSKVPAIYGPSADEQPGA